MVYPDEFKKKVIDYFELSPDETNLMNSFGYDCMMHSLEMGDESIGDLLFQIATRDVDNYNPFDFMFDENERNKILRETTRVYEARGLYFEWFLLWYAYTLTKGDKIDNPSIEHK